MDKKFKINMVSTSGHDTLTFDNAEQAIKKAKELATKEDKWIYVDHKLTEVEDLHASMINEENTIFLTNPLVGG